MRPLLNAAISLIIAASASAAPPVPSPAWGSLEGVADAPGAFTSAVPEHEEATKLFFPAPFPNIVRATLDGDPVVTEFNEDASQIALALEAGAGGKLRLELAEGTIQQSDGRIVFSALDAKVVGKKAKLETHPGNHRIGFWADPADTVKWDYKASRWGMYDLAITYSLASGKSVVELGFGGETLEVELEATGSWYRYTTVDAGRLYLAKAGNTALTVTPKSKTGGAVMNLKAVLLDPAPEGGAIAQDGDTITLHSRDATVHGVKLRYEPIEKKNCLGFWSNPADRASWEFDAKSTGRYKVVLTQGCGKGHGGSVAKILLGDQEVEFTVEDTGGFQNWKRRELGTMAIERAGKHRLEVRPVSKKGVAVMDIQQIQLVKE